MSTATEIQAVLPQLTNEDLRKVEEAVHGEYRKRHTAIVYDDSYGVVTEADLIASAEEAFLTYDQQEIKNGKTGPR